MLGLSVISLTDDTGRSPNKRHLPPQLCLAFYKPVKIQTVNVINFDSEPILILTQKGPWIASTFFEKKAENIFQIWAWRRPIAGNCDSHLFKSNEKSAVRLRYSSSL